MKKLLVSLVLVLFSVVIFAQTNNDCYPSVPVDHNQFGQAFFINGQLNTAEKAGEGYEELLVATGEITGGVQNAINHVNAALINPLVTVTGRISGVKNGKVAFSDGLGTYRGRYWFTSNGVAYYLRESCNNAIATCAPQQPTTFPCWDTNRNGRPDAWEDVNRDGVWSTDDCNYTPPAPPQQNCDMCDKLDSIQNQLDRIEAKVDRNSRQIQQVDEKVDRVERKVDVVIDMLRAMDSDTNIVVVNNYNNTYVQQVQNPARVHRAWVQTQWVPAMAALGSVSIQPVFIRYRGQYGVRYNNQIYVPRGPQWNPRAPRQNTPRPGTIITNNPRQNTPRPTGNNGNSGYRQNSNRPGGGR